MFLKTKMKCIYRCDSYIWKLLLLSIIFVSIKHLDSSKIFSGFTDFHQHFAFSDFHEKNVSMILKNQMRIIFGFDLCIRKLLLMSLNVVSIVYLDSFNISSGFPDFYHNFYYYDMCQ